MVSNHKKDPGHRSRTDRQRTTADAVTDVKESKDQTTTKAPMSNRQSKQDTDDLTVKDNDEESNDTDESEEDVLDRTKLELASHPMPPVEGLVRALRQFKNLQKLDVSDMKPSEENGNPNGLESLEWLGKAATPPKKGDSTDMFGNRLTWFKCSDNVSLGERAGKAAWNGLDRLVHLTVLNASSCALPIAPPASMLIAWPSLAALILGHNAISELTHFPHMPVLNTLVLSHNALTSLPSDLPINLPGLKKISLTHNKLVWGKGSGGRVSPLPDFSVCSHLREVRISGNTKLSRLPTHLHTWGRGTGKERKGTGLEIFEAGDCGLADWDAIAPLMLPTSTVLDGKDAKEDMVHPSRRRMRGFSTLLLRGNDVARLPDYRVRVLALHTGLRVLDSEKVGRGVAPAVVVQPTAKKDDVREDRKLEGTSDRLSGKKADRLQGNSQVAISENKPVTATVAKREEDRANKKPPTVQKEKTNTQQGDDTHKKAHKRGSRGKAKGGKRSEHEEVAPVIQDPFLESGSRKGDDDDLARIRARAGPPENTSVMKRARKNNPSSDDLDLARIRARAGPIAERTTKGQANQEKPVKPSKPAKVKAGDMRASVDKSKKRKAWDEEEAPIVKKSKASAPQAPQHEQIQQAALPKKEDAPAARELTSVAGVVDVRGTKGSGKKKSGKPFESRETTRKAPVWGLDKQATEVSLGLGGAWD